MVNIIVLVAVLLSSVEEQHYFTPVLYGDATSITFSNGISFDTRTLGKDGEPHLPLDLRYTADEAEYYIVQFNGPIYQEQKDWLESMNAKIHFVVPRYGFVCRVKDQIVVDQIRDNPSVNWVGIYQPAYKISALFDQVGNEHKVTILLFMDADISDALERVKSITNRAEFTISDNGINKIIQGVISKHDITKLAHINGIYWIEPYIQPELHIPNIQWIIQTAVNNNRKVWDMGITGQGEIVNYFDTGINTSDYFFRAGSPAIPTWGYYPTHNKIVAYDSGAPRYIAFGDPTYHGTRVGRVLAGNDTILSGSSYDGIAKGAKIYFNDCGDASGMMYIYPDLNDAYIRPYNKYFPPTRAHMSSNSWGASVGGAYTATCLQVDQFMWGHKDFLLFYTVGNAGMVDSSVGAPASAKNVIAVGGSSDISQLWNWSSRGPAQDGRLKPTVLSHCHNIDFDPGFYSGTSLASPGAGGAAALARQYLREGWYPTGKKTEADSFAFISASLLKAILVNSAINIDTFFAPDNNIGWGLVVLDSTLYFAGDERRIIVVDNTTGVFTGEQVDYHFNLPPNTQNLKIALAWTDYPGNPAVLTQIVNDLDLTAYFGAIYYRGNQYSGEESMINPPGRDSINLEECIRVINPIGGDWCVSIAGRNVPIGPQPFALVISYIAPSSAGVVTLDKPVYRVNDFAIDTVQIRVEDTNYGSASVADSLQIVFHGALIETQPETLWSFELAESAYVFKAEFPLLFHKPVHGDGKLSVCQDDTITVSYSDTNPSYTSTTWASVDASYFIISDVHCENIDENSGEVCWTTNENSNSTVYYGIDPGNLNQIVSLDTPFVFSHRIRLSGLSGNTLYYYDVESKDFRGNIVRDNNGGQHYTFTTKGGGGLDVMVVVLNSDAYDSAFVHHDFLEDALDSGGWTYSWWQTKSDGDFSWDLLKQYKAVFFQIGQVGGMGGNYPVWTVAQKESIKVYHDGGARFSVTGFDIGWDPWYNSPSADTNFCKDYLHFRYVGDIVQTTWNTLYGMPGDPISGAYTGGVIYHPCRSGAAGDSIRLSGTGATGTGSYVWHGNVANDSCSIKWESQDTMGISGDGVWGGYQTRVVTNAFEITQIDTTNPNSPERTDILNKMFIWLIGHDHPDVTLSSPQGGQTYNSSPITVDWVAAAYGGASIDTTWIEYSSDGGQTWIEIVSATGITSPYDWDVSSLTNGARYQVRVIVSDKDVYPSVKGSDVTGNFTINIPGNDFLGPRIIPQSIEVESNPKIVTPTDTSMYFTAIVSDSLSGLSNIAAAEWSVGSTPNPPGTGVAMSARDGSFDEVEEGVIDTMYFIYNPGWTEICTLWVRGYDALDNWGNALLRTFTLIDGQVVIGISEDGRAIPMHWSLSKPRPNPFTKNVVIVYGVPKRSCVSLKIYNILGQVVKTLTDGRTEPGIYTMYWDGRDDLDRKVSAGVYFVRVEAAAYEKTEKVVLLK
ncbi:MAG: S8 family serine peptidase [bacterium]